MENIQKVLAALGSINRGVILDALLCQHDCYILDLILPNAGTPPCNFKHHELSLYMSVQQGQSRKAKSLGLAVQLGEVL